MQYNFDEIIDRRGTDALKIDAVPNRLCPSDLKTEYRWMRIWYLMCVFCQIRFISTN